MSLSQLPAGPTIADQVGHTRLIRLRSLEPDGVEIHAKAEWENPAGSVKDRPALAMIREGERTGRLDPSRVILDASSGNTGLAYAALGSALGYRVRIVVPGNISPVRFRLLDVYGADIVVSDPAEGVDGAIDEARRLLAENPDRYFYPDQYNNPENWKAHFEGTGLEIIRQTRGRVTHFVAGLGTSGTFVGVGRRLRVFDPRIELVAMQPDSPLHAMEGLKHMDTTRHVPGIFDPALADRTEIVSTEEARETAFRIGREEGILVGPSGAAAATAARRVAARLGQGVVVTVLPDSATKYLGDPFWEPS